MKYSFLNSKIFIWLFKVACKNLQIVLKIFRDLLFSGGLNVANTLNKKLYNAFGVERVRLVHLHTHILNRILCPELILTLAEEHQWERNLVHYDIDVIIDHPPRLLELQSNLDCLQCCTESLRAHELGALCEDDVQMTLQDQSDVVLLNVGAEHVVLDRLRILVPTSLTHRTRTISIFN